jgi:hypothetical protein
MPEFSEHGKLSNELTNRFYASIENDPSPIRLDDVKYELADDEIYEKLGYDPFGEPTLIQNSESGEIFAVFIDVSVIPEKLVAQ